MPRHLRFRRGPQSRAQLSAVRRRRRACCQEDLQRRERARVHAVALTHFDVLRRHGRKAGGLRLREGETCSRRREGGELHGAGRDVGVAGQGRLGWLRPAGAAAAATCPKPFSHVARFGQHREGRVRAVRIDLYSHRLVRQWVADGGSQYLVRRELRGSGWRVVDHLEQAAASLLLRSLLGLLPVALCDVLSRDRPNCRSRSVQRRPGVSSVGRYPGTDVDRHGAPVPN